MDKLNITLLQKQYAGAVVHDMVKDIVQSTMPEYCASIDLIPKDNVGMPTGKYSVTITWESD